MQNHILREIVEMYLDRDDRNQSYLARQLGRRPDQVGRWLNGANQIPYQEVGEIARILHITPAEQMELYAAAGYPLPGWVRHPGERELVAAARATEAEDGKTILRLPSVLQHAEYLEQRLRAARHSVEERRSGFDALCLAPEEAQAYQACARTILELCRRRVVYRGLAVTRDQHLSQNAATAHSERLRTFNARALAPALRQRLHLLDFVIIDGKEVILALHHHASLPTDREIRLAVRHPDLVALFRAYFDAAWATAHVIKEGDDLPRRRFDQPDRRTMRAAAD